MSARTLALSVLVLSAVSATTILRAEPQPTPAPTKWELTFKPDQLQKITASDRSGQSKTYWYLIYRVVNNTGEDVDFLPVIERVSDITTELPADKAEQSPDKASKLIVDPAITGIDPNVFKAIKQRHARTYPLLVSPVEVIGRIRQGIDNSRESVAVFKDLDPRVSKFTIYVGGLSGERQTLPNPSYRKPAKAPEGEVAAPAAPTPDEKNSPVFIIQKTLALPYALPGDGSTRRYATPALGRPEWVMR